MNKTHARLIEQPPTNIDYLSEVGAAYFGSGFYAWPAIILLMIGVWYAIEHRSAMRLLFPVIFVAPILMSVRGVSAYTWDYARYMIYTLPFLFILICYALLKLLKQFERPLIYLFFIGILATCWGPMFMKRFAAKSLYPWNKIRNYININSAPGDIAVGINYGTFLHLDPIPNSASYKRLQLEQLTPEIFRDGKSSNHKVFLVLNNIQLKTDHHIERFGNVYLKPQRKTPSFR